MTITPEDVAKLAAAATPGPWRAFADETAAQVKGFPCIEADTYEVVGFEGMYGHYETDWANATFIAAAHDMAALIAEQEAKLKKAVAALELYSCDDGCNECPESERDRVSCGWTARAALASIKEGGA